MLSLKGSEFVSITHGDGPVERYINDETKLALGGSYEVEAEEIMLTERGTREEKAALISSAEHNESTDPSGSRSRASPKWWI